MVRDVPKAAMTETYADMERWVHGTIHKFAEHFGVRNKEELVSEAGVAFVKAVTTYTKDRGSISNWLRVKIWKELLSARRREARRELRARELREALKRRSRIAYTAESRAWEGLRATLSPDAARVASLALYPHPTVDLGIAERGGPESPKNYRDSIKEYLTDLGWPRERIREAFLELREALG